MKSSTEVKEAKMREDLAKAILADSLKATTASGKKRPRETQVKTERQKKELDQENGPSEVKEEKGSVDDEPEMKKPRLTPDSGLLKSVVFIHLSP